LAGGEPVAAAGRRAPGPGPAGRERGRGEFGLYGTPSGWPRRWSCL